MKGIVITSGTNIIRAAQMQNHFEIILSDVLICLPEFKDNTPYKYKKNLNEYFIFS